MAADTHLLVGNGRKLPPPLSASTLRLRFSGVVAQPIAALLEYEDLPLRWFLVRALFT